MQSPTTHTLKNTASNRCAPDTRAVAQLSAEDMRIAQATEILKGKAGIRQFGFQMLLTPEGYAPKTDKGRARGYSTAIMYFAPADLLRL